MPQQLESSLRRARQECPEQSHGIAVIDSEQCSLRRDGHQPICSLVLLVRVLGQPAEELPYHQYTHVTAIHASTPWTPWRQLAPAPAATSDRTAARCFLLKNSIIQALGIAMVKHAPAVSTSKWTSLQLWPACTIVCVIDCEMKS